MSMEILVPIHALGGECYITQHVAEGRAGDHAVQVGMVLGGGDLLIEVDRRRYLVRLRDVIEGVVAEVTVPDSVAEGLLANSRDGGAA